MTGTRIVAALACVALSACATVPASNPAPEPTLPLLSDLELAEDAQSLTLAAPPQVEAGGFFARLMGRDAPSQPSAIDAAVDEALGDEAPQDTITDAEENATNAPAQAPVTAAQADRGMLGRIFNASAGSSEPVTQPSNAVPPDTIMAFGAIAPTCGLSRRDMGTEIAKASGYTIYDTIPNSTAPRPHYITGFNDGCARQFTAALVILGDIGTHEVVRYNRTRVELPYSDTDNAYEAIKASFCRSGFGKPCGARLERLANRTTFVSAYERFGAGPIWAEFLLHDGDVAAADIEGK